VRLATTSQEVRPATTSQEVRPATTSQEVTIDRVPAIDPTPTGPSLIDTLRTPELAASRHRLHFPSYAAAVAVSMVCASVAISYPERLEVLKPSVDAIRRLLEPVLNRSSDVTQPARSQPEVTAPSLALASPPLAAPGTEQVEPVQAPAELQRREFEVSAARPGLAGPSAPSEHQGSAPPRSTPSGLDARIGIDRRSIPTVTSEAAVTAPKVVSSDGSDRSVNSPQTSVISTPPATAAGRGGIAEATAPSAPIAPPAPVSVPTVVAPVPVPAVPTRDALAAVASPTSAPLSASPAGTSTATVIPSNVQVEQNIRDVLQRYALAYRHLDANAAKVVWPSVDVRALTRAFGGLESQDLTFSGCELRIGGAEAQAICHGSATYVPKIGSKEPRTLRRDWVFKLRELETGWTIAQSETR
jgi:hypothetical protein